MQKNDLRPHLSEYWCIPPKEDAEFVAAMEDVLDVYHQPYNATAPLWCMDEKPYQLLGESREPLPLRPGDVAKVDAEYVRNGTVSVFCFIQPHTSRITHAVEPTRTAVDWAEKIKFLIDDINPDADKIVLVCDNPIRIRLHRSTRHFHPRRREDSPGNLRFTIHLNTAAGST